MVSTTHYWSSIHVDKPGRVPSRRASIIKIWLDRSGVHRPLSISIECPQMQMKRAQKYLEIFAPYNHRVKYLRFASLAAFSDILLKEPFPILETLDFYHMSSFVRDRHSTETLAASWGAASFLHDARTNKDIHIPQSAIQLKRILFPPLSLPYHQRQGDIALINLRYSIWENITRLEWVPINSFPDLSLIFRQCSSLKHCVCVEHWPIYLRNHSPAMIQHDHLQSWIIHSQFSSHMTAPELLFESLTLPKLKHLEMHHYREMTIPLSVLSDFFQRSRSSEKLKSLKIYIRSDYSYPQPISDFDDDHIVALIQALRGLVEFVAVQRKEGIEYDLVTEAMRDVINVRLLA